MARRQFVQKLHVDVPSATVTIYRDPACTVLADVQTLAGATIPGSVITVGLDRKVEFLGPPGARVLYTKPSALNPSQVTVLSATDDADTVEHDEVSREFGGVLAANPEGLIFGTITRNTDGTVTSAPVVWPDGSTGTYTATSTSADGVLAYTVTRVTGGVTTTYTQPAMTRDSSGAVTVRPSMTVA